MAILIAGLVLFLGIHTLPWLPSAHQSLQQKFGNKAFRGIFSLIAMVGFILIIVGKAKAEFHSLWVPPAWGRMAAVPLIYLAFILLPAANMPCNIKRWVRHPMLIGVILWGGAHLLANGDLASALLFGSFVVYSLIDIVSANARGKNKDLPVLPPKKDIVVVAAGTTAFIALLFLHPYLFGVPVIL